ncbi:unnamed protein product [Closterium sp. Yama58-4]|nr:unnamed protein product [Closterium sp. Yama58-4]
MASLLERTEIGALVPEKREIISVPDTATVLDALELMNASGIVALPVAAPPGKWLGAGGANIVDGEKQYIGVVSMADVAMHLGVVSMADVAMHLVREGARPAALKAGVVSLIGNSPEGLSLWVASSSTPLVDAMEPLSKGIHRLLTDVAAFLLLHVDALGDVAQRTVEQLGLADPLFPPLAIVSGMTVTDALRLMQRAGGVRAVAVAAGSAEEEERMEEGEGSGASSAAAGADVRDFLAHMASLSPEGRRPSITCRMAAPLAEVMALAVTNRVHRVWVTGEEDELLGVVSLTDVISACRRASGQR